MLILYVFLVFWLENNGAKKIPLDFYMHFNNVRFTLEYFYFLSCKLLFTVEEVERLEV